MEALDFNTALAKKLQQLKQDLNATKVRQGYRGTGAQAHRRQIWVDFANGQAIDLWLGEKSVELGGVCHTNYGRVLTLCIEKSPSESYDEIVQKLRPLAQKEQAQNDSKR